MSTLAVATVQSVNSTTTLSLNTGNTTGGSTLYIGTGGFSGVHSNRTSAVGSISYGEGTFECVGIGEEYPYLGVIAHASTTTTQYPELSLFKSRGTYTAGVPTSSSTVDGDVLGVVASYARNTTGWTKANEIQFIQTGGVAANGKVAGRMEFYTTDTAIGGTVKMLTINTTAVSVSSTNTFNLGTASKAANGYTYLPNGLIMQWGRVAANSTTAGDITFPVAFPTTCVSFTYSGQVAASNGIYTSTAPTTTGAGVRSANAANPATANVFYTAIGY